MLTFTHQVLIIMLRLLTLMAVGDSVSSLAVCEWATNNELVIAILSSNLINAINTIYFSQNLANCCCHPIQLPISDYIFDTQDMTILFVYDSFKNQRVSWVNLCNRYVNHHYYLNYLWCWWYEYGFQKMPLINHFL